MARRTGISVFFWFAVVGIATEYLDNPEIEWSLEWGSLSEQLKNPERQRMGIGHFVSRAAELHPDRIAIDDLLNRRTLNYVELDARINRLGRALIRQGVRRGDMVASMLRNEHALVETVFACARIGAIVAP